MFQHIASSTNPEGNGIGGYNFVFHTEALPANTVAVMGVTALEGKTVTVSDTRAGSWSAAVCSAKGGSGKYDSWVFVQALGPNSGTDTITINVGASNTNPVQFDITFWQNINTSSPVNGSNCTGNITPAAGGVINPGSFTPTTNNDASGGNVIWNYTPLCGGANNNPTNWVAGSGFSLLNGDIIWLSKQGFPEASEYSVQATQAPVEASITATGDTTDCYNSTTVALAVADNGATAPATIHVAAIIHESYDTFLSPGTQKIRFPTVGNLRVATFSWFDACPGAGTGCLSALSSSDGCPWTLMVPGGAGGIAYAQNCNPCPNCTLSLIYTGSQQLPQASFRLYDVQNASTSSFQNVAGAYISPCNTSVTDAPSITPSGASNGLTIAVMGNGAGPITAVTSPVGAVFDLWLFTGETDTDMADNADASSHFYFSSTATQNWNYTKTIPNDQCYPAAATFN